MSTKRLTLLQNFKTWFITSIIGAVVNSALFFLTSLTGLFNELAVPPDSIRPLTIVNIISASFMFPLVATVFYSFLQVVTQKHITLVRWIGYIFMVLSFWSPTGIEGISILEIVILNIMHVVTAVLFIEGITRYFGKQEVDKKTIHA
jgi:hypothetical protein